MESKSKLRYKVTGTWYQIVKPRAGVTDRQLRDGIAKGVYKSDPNSNKIIDTISKTWVATVHMSGPEDGFMWELVT